MAKLKLKAKKPSNKNMRVTREDLTAEISIGNPRWQTSPGLLFNPDRIARTKTLAEYDLVRRDEQVKAAMNFKKLATLKSGWVVESPEGKPKDWPVTKFVEQQFNQMRGTFNETLMQIMLGLDYGFSVSEKVYKQIAEGPWRNKIGLQAIKTRAPYDIRFHTDAKGNLLPDGIEQNGNRFNPAKFVLFTNNPEFGNPYGRSDLEAVYRPWYLKDMSYKWLGMGLERFGVHPLIAFYNQAIVPKETQTKFAAVLRNLSGASSAAVPRGASKEDIDIWTHTHSGEMVKAFKDVFLLLDSAISRGILMPSLIGMTPDEGQGSRARSSVHFDTFTMVVESLRQTIEEDVVQEQVVKQLVDMNFFVDDYPKFKFLPIDDQLNAELLAAWQNLVNGGSVSVSDKDEDHIREMMKFPDRIIGNPRKTAVPLGDPFGGKGKEPDTEEDDAEDTEDDASKNKKVKTKTQRYTVDRILSDPEMRVNFAQLKRDLDEGTLKWVNSLKKQMEACLSGVKDEIEKSYKPSLKYVEDFDYKFDKKLERKIFEFFADLFQMGRADVKREMPKKFVILPNVDPADALAYLEKKAVMIAGVLQQKLVDDAKSAMLLGLKNGDSNAEIINRIEEIFAPYVGSVVAGEVVQPSRIETIVRTNLTDAYNQGRLVQGEMAGELLEGWKYSAILDSRTTEVCSQLDGKVFKAGDKAIYKLKPPRHFNCRSVLVPIVVGDTYEDDELIKSEEIDKALKESGAGF